MVQIVNRTDTPQSVYEAFATIAPTFVLAAIARRHGYKSARDFTATPNAAVLVVAAFKLFDGNAEPDLAMRMVDTLGRIAADPAFAPPGEARAADAAERGYEGEGA